MKLFPVAVACGLAIGAALDLATGADAQPAPPPPNLAGTAPITVTPSGPSYAPRVIACPTCSTSSASGTVTSVAAGTGLAASPSPITGTGTVSLANTAVTPGTYGDATHAPVVTVDAQGRITLATVAAITAGGSGTVTSLAAGTGIALSPSPITATGTVSLGSIGTNNVLANLGAAGAPSGTSISSVVPLACGGAGQLHYTSNPVNSMGCLSGGSSGTVLSANGAFGFNFIAVPYSVSVKWKASETVAADTLPVLIASAAGTIKSVSYLVAGGTTPSFGLAVTINGTNVTGCNGLTVSAATQTTTTCSAANTFSAGGIVRVVTSAPSGTPSDAIVQVNYTMP